MTNAGIITHVALPMEINVSHRGKEWSQSLDTLAKAELNQGSQGVLFDQANEMLSALRLERADGWVSIPSAKVIASGEVIYGLKFRAVSRWSNGEGRATIVSEDSMVVDVTDLMRELESFIRSA